MNKRIILTLLVLGAIAGILAVIYYILLPVLPSPIAPQPPAPTQLPSERPFNPTPDLPKAPTTTGNVDANSPAERERQAQEALKRVALDLATRINTYSNADDFEALRQAQAIVDASYAKELDSLRQVLRQDHPSFGDSYGVTMNSLSAVINSPTPILTSTQASVSVQAQRVIESQRKPSDIQMVQINLQFTKNGTTWVVTDQSIKVVE